MLPNIYADYMRVVDSDDICSICLEAKCDMVTGCDHAYHLKCFLSWMKTNNVSCPNCKQTEFSLRYFCVKCKGYFCSLTDTDMIQKCAPYLEEFPRCDECYRTELAQAEEERVSKQKTSRGGQRE